MCNRSGCYRMCEKIMLWIITADVAASLVFFFSWAFVVLVESFESFGVWFMTHVECHLIIICMQVHIGGWERQCSRAWLQVQLWVSSYNVSQTLLQFAACVGMESSWPNVREMFCREALIYLFFQFFSYVVLSGRSSHGEDWGWEFVA